MRIRVPIAILLLIATGLHAQTINRYGTPTSWECPGAVAAGSSGKTMAAGLYMSSGNTDALLLLVNADGVLQSAKRIAGAGNDQFQDVKRAADGSFIAVGTTNSVGAGLFDGLIVKLNATGLPSWRRVFGSAADEHFAHITQTRDRAFVVLGDTSNADTGNDLMVVKFSPAGGVVWKRTLATPGFDHASGIVATSDGGVLVSSNTDIPGGKTVGVVTRLAPTGGVIWSRTFSSSFHFHAGAQILEATDGTLFFLQYVAADINVNSRAVVSRLSSSGNVLWSRMIRQGTTPLAIFSAVLSPDGGVVLAGTAGDTRGLMVKLDENGKIVWKETLQLPGNTVSMDGIDVDLTGQSFVFSACVYPDNAIDIDTAIVRLPLTGAAGSGCGSLTSAPLSISGFSVISGPNSFTQPTGSFSVASAALAVSSVALPTGRVCSATKK